MRRQDVVLSPTLKELSNARLSRFSHYRRELVLSGFIRSHSGNLSVPLSIIELICRKFWYQITYFWRLYGNSFNRFCSSSKTAIKNQIIILNKTQIECVIVKKTDCSQLYLKTDFNGYPLTTYFELYCKETKSEHRGIKTFEKTSVVSMDLDKIEYEKSISLSIYIDPKWYQKSSKLHAKYKYKWNITESQLNYMKSDKCEHGKCILSDNFDGDHWFLKCAPKGYDEENRNNVCLYLVLLAIKSKKIYCMDIAYILESNYLNIKQEFIKTFYSINTESETWSINTFPSKALKSINKLSFTVTIQILNVYGQSGKQISSPYILQ